MHLLEEREGLGRRVGEGVASDEGVPHEGVGMVSV